MDEDSVLGHAYRLRLTREALGLSQAEICRQTGIGTSSWNNAETGDARLGYENAIKVCKRYGVTLEWLIRGDMYGLPGELARMIGNLHNSGTVPRPGPRIDQMDSHLKRGKGPKGPDSGEG